jgi:hypothetical protein
MRISPRKPWLARVAVAVPPAVAGMVVSSVPARTAVGGQRTGATTTKGPR